MTRSSWIIIGGVALVTVGTGLYFFVLRKKDGASDKYGNLTLKATDKQATGGLGGGVQTSKENVSKVEPNWENPFDVSYSEDVRKWLPTKSIILLKSQPAKDAAKQIYDAKGILNDDEESVRDVFKNKVRDKVQVSNVSQAFYTQYKKDLYDYLRSFLSESEMEQYVWSVVRNLPNYRTA